METRCVTLCLTTIRRVAPNSHGIPWVYDMVRDRISELCANRRHGSFGRGLLQDVHIPISQNKKVNNILGEAEKIRELIQLISVNVGIVKDLHNNVLSHTNSDISKELEGRTFIIGQTSQRIRRELKEMSKDIPNIDDYSAMEAAREGPTYKRIKLLQYTTMRQTFLETMFEYNESLMRYHEKCSSILNQQRVLIRKSSAKDEPTQQNGNEESTSLFVDNILEDSRTARLQLSEIQSRHEEVLKLEKSISEIRDIFLEMAYSIEKQGHQINCVEYFAGQATENVDSGRCDLTKAEKRSSRYRSRKYKIFMCIAAIVIILIIIAIYL